MIFKKKLVLLVILYNSDTENHRRQFSALTVSIFWCPAGTVKVIVAIAVETDDLTT